MEGREELFEHERHKEPVQVGIVVNWHVLNWNEQVSNWCQVEFGRSERADTVPCGKPAIAECADSGAAICSECRSECCGDSFCGQCYDYHVTHSCVRKFLQNQRKTGFKFSAYAQQGRLKQASHKCRAGCC
jgi:hypothetical protein